MTASLDPDRVRHRPWPAPERPWALEMHWHDLAFLHWPVPPDTLRPLLPRGLELDTFEGSAWLGVVPFRMSHVRPRLVPAVPGVSAFPELNLRTYATAGDKPGVWFFSLDVTKRLAVVAARVAFHLPYHRARMRVTREGERIRYESERHGAAPAGFAGSYRGRGSVFRSAPGSLEEWLTERYCPYSADRRGRLYRGDVHHDPWPLERADVEITRNTMAEAIGVRLGPGEPLAHFARKLEVIAWSLRAVG